MADDHDDDDVGYGKPPKRHQFKPGQSGNPKGRAKGSRGLKTDLTAVLGAKQTIPTKKGDLSGTRQYLTLATLATRAAHGDLKAQALLIPLIVQVLGVEDRGAGDRSLSPQDQAILDGYLRRHDAPSSPQPKEEEVCKGKDNDGGGDG